MRNKICNFLNRPFPLFLSYRKGRYYFIWMIFVLVVLANLMQPLGLYNMYNFHKPLVLANYIILFYGVYALLYMILSYFRSDYYKANTWTIKKEFQTLLFYIPTTVCSTYLFADFSVPEFELSLSSFLELQLYNGILGVITVPAFGYFVDSKLNPINEALRSKQKENKESGVNLNEQQARDILQKLNKVMEIQQLYLSNKCSIKLVASYAGISAHHISTAINSYSEHNFTDFVNKYRVEHFCRIVQDGKNKRLKLEAVGLECGFGSKVNFYTAFRKFKGKTPAEYLAGL
ncbi:MAG TPA: helix-turn-helix domain-containing protein [Paludibacter sp.]|nr:helix-turn-helix domain-containing protein [Paludibacter sp.]